MDIKKCESNFQILGNRILSLKTKNDFVVLENVQTVKKKIELTHEIEDIETNEKGELRGLLVLNIKVKLQSGNKKFILEVVLEGCFMANNSMEEQKFRELLGINGVTALYGIARSAILSITSQMFIQGNILLPMINVFEYSREISSVEQTKK